MQGSTLPRGPEREEGEMKVYEEIYESTRLDVSTWGYLILAGIVGLGFLLDWIEARGRKRK